MMESAVRAGLGSFRALGARERLLAELLTTAKTGFIEANPSPNFPVVRRGGMGYGLFCGGSKPAREGEVVLNIPPSLWAPFCAENAVRKAGTGAPGLFTHLRNVTKHMNVADPSKLTSVTCLAIELLVTLASDPDHPYLGLLWDASHAKGALPHPLLMERRHLEPLQASPLRDSIERAVRLYTDLHSKVFGFRGDDRMASGDIKGDGVSPKSSRDFLWALGAILSRGISEDAAGGTGLVPFLDFANHAGDREKTADGSRTGVVSCERGFDVKSGCHFLRTVKEVRPGEELLIDYGSSEKGMYSFTRTYGFIDGLRINEKSVLEKGQENKISSTSDVLRVKAEKRPQQPESPEPGTGEAGEKTVLKEFYEFEPTRRQSPGTTTEMIDLCVDLAVVDDVLDRGLRPLDISGSFEDIFEGLEDPLNRSDPVEPGGESMPPFASPESETADDPNEPRPSDVPPHEYQSRMSDLIYSIHGTRRSTLTPWQSAWAPGDPYGPDGDAPFSESDDLKFDGVEDFAQPDFSEPPEGDSESQDSNTFGGSTSEESDSQEGSNFHSNKPLFRMEDFDFEVNPSDSTDEDESTTEFFREMKLSPDLANLQEDEMENIEGALEDVADEELNEKQYLIQVFEERLFQYPTTLDEDLELLRSKEGEWGGGGDAGGRERKMAGKGKARGQDGKSFGGHGTRGEGQNRIVREYEMRGVVDNWEYMCVRLRVAEKLALLFALRDKAQSKY